VRVPGFRLVTYNVHRCVGIDGRLRPERIAAVIRACAPDIVALQELDVRRLRTNRVDQPRMLADLLRMDVLFCSLIRLGRGEYGTAVLSPWPLRVIRSGKLPTLHDRRLENRGALWAAVRMGGLEINVINTHLGLTRGERRLQAEELLGGKWLAHPDCREPRILCGDFNMSRRGEYVCFDGACVAGIWHQAGPPPRTWPSPLPLLSLDHVFHSRGLVARSLRAVDDGAARWASDHLPVVVDFEAPDA
jgi:endonuclease/exonuclease/phosphatase family metal-dependent hydrolase